MTLVASIVLGFSIFAVIALFAFKRYEVAHPDKTRAAWRDDADDFALRVKWVFLVVEWYLARAPLFFLLFVRWLVRAGALGIARIARLSEEQAQRLADMASHKRNFERRETQSTYLKQVSEYKNGNGAGSHDMAGRL